MDYKDFFMQTHIEKRCFSFQIEKSSLVFFGAVLMLVNEDSLILSFKTQK